METMQANSLEIVRSILRRHFQVSQWNITNPPDGQQKACFVARSADQSVFIKLDVPIAALHRLGEIGVAPQVLASGEVGGISYVIQEFVVGMYPDRQWFANHLATLARFIKRYHDDYPLTALLSMHVTTGFANHITLDLSTLEQQFRSLDVTELHTLEVELSFERLKSWSKHLNSAILVPIHPDPNTKNILLFNDSLVMVDWDDMKLSDPMRDVGLLLWWYVSQHRWEEFFREFGLQMDEALLERIFWWAARTSFAIALWHIEHGYDCQAFLKDFQAALNKENNPHAVFGL
jgi:aminoglycoside phosphotransferase (APT) family kinase protein